MPDGLDFSCEGGRCIWQWNANRFPVDELTIRVRQSDGELELRRVPNTGQLVLPEEVEVMEIVTEPHSEGRRRRPKGWRGPG